jgi:hypothetical protein
VTDLGAWVQAHAAILFTLCYLATIIALTLMMTARQEEHH